MKKLLKSLILLGLSPLPTAYQLHQDAITQKQTQITYDLKKRHVGRGVLHVVVFGTILSECWQWYGLLTSDDTNNAIQSPHSHGISWSKVAQTFMQSKLVWEKVGSYGLKICSLYLIQCLLQRMERSVMAVENIDWCMQTYAPYENTIAQLRSYGQEQSMTSYHEKMIKKDLHILCDQLEYLIAYLYVQAEKVGGKKNKYHQMAAYLFQTINTLLNEISLKPYDAFLARLDELELIVNREVNQVRIIQGVKKEYTVFVHF